MASITEKPVEFRTLDCLGAFKDEKNSRYGFVYILPDHLWTVKEMALKPEDVSRCRKPTSLLSLMEGPDKRGAAIPHEFDLGSRISLAKKLAQSLLVLHAAGWVHKKYVFV